jgi:penicillin-binding protein 1A
VSRRNAVLTAMRDSGAITPADYETAVTSAPELQDALRGQETYGQYFKEEVRKQLIQQFGWEAVHYDGLQVYTTLDLDMQKLAEAEIRKSIEEIERRQPARMKSDKGNPLQAALVALDPRTGEVRAMVGGRSYDASRFNRATQAKRQPGSAFKPFIYAAALERGYSPASILDALDTPVMTVQGAWVPEDHGGGSAMSIRAAMRTSSNRAAVRMLQEIGIPAAVGHATRLGVGSVPSVPSLALGSGEVTLMSMTSAYAAFDNQGLVPTPMLIRRVESPDGEVLYHAAPRLARAVSEATAFLMTSMMADVVNAGTAWQARRVGFTLPAAGKTGTTNDYRDAWFVGYTPSLVTGVWIGYDQPRTIIGRGYAGTLAVPLWGRFMAEATRGQKPEPFAKPRTVTTATICRLTGKLATEECRTHETLDAEGFPMISSQVYTEYFVRGTEPSEYCDWHDTYHSISPPAVVASAPGPGPAPAAVPAAAAASATALSGSTIQSASGAAVPVATTGTASAAAAATDATPAQRGRAGGFWRRFFGMGRGGQQQPPPRDTPAEKKRQ